MKRIPLSAEWMLIISFAIFKLAIHFFTNTNYGLHRDEYLYLALADHLDFGFVSVPPSIAAFARIASILFGDSVFGVRFFPALIGAASVVIIGLMAKNLGGGKWAIGLACTAFIVSPAFLRSNSLFMPVSFDQFYWLLSAYFILKLIQTQNPKFWIHLGIVAGLAFLNKYAIAFLILAFIFALLLTPHRKLFLSKYFALSLLIGFVIIVPNLIWQFNHNWPVVGHMAELQRTQLVNVNIPDFIIMQFLMNLPGVFVWLAGFVFLLFFADGKYRALGYTFLGVFLLLILLRGKHYYTLGIYTPLFAAGGYAIEQSFTNRFSFVKPALIALMVVITLPVVPYSLPVLTYDEMVVYAEKSKRFGLEGALRWEDGRVHSLPQDYADMTGWEELGEKVATVYQNLSATEKAQCAIYAENYGEAGAVKYFGKKYGLPEPICFNETFLLWAPDSANTNMVIYINDETDDIDYFFSEVKRVGEISNPYARENGLPIYLCRNPQNGFADFYREMVGGLKSNYR